MNVTRQKPPPDLLFDLDANAEALADWAKKPPKKKGPGSLSTDAMARAASEVDAMIAGGDWSAATGRHFVALYGFLHARIYGVEPTMTGRERMLAAAAAARMLAGEFGSDGDAMADFVRWTWRREAGRERWRRENQRSGGHVGWRLQFAGAIVTEYRLDLARTRKR